MLKNSRRIVDKKEINQQRPINETPIKGIRLGKLEMKSDMCMLNLADFLKVDLSKVPPVFLPWKKKTKFPIRTFGNTENGCCTRAKQAILAMRMERLEQRRTLNISDAEVLRVYYEMTKELYGGGDTGAYELDALKRWRDPLKTFKDSKGRPYTIDAFSRINQFRLEEVKAALFLSQGQGIAICLNLPMAWSRIPGGTWDVPDGVRVGVGEYRPGSWGGHSIAAHGYDEKGIHIMNTWGYQDHVVTWKAFAAYCDEAYSTVDSINHWKKKKEINKLIDLTNLKAEVNKVSDIQIGK